MSVMKLRLTNTMSGTVHILDFEDAGTSGLYWKGVIDVPAELSDGEYKYELLDNESLDGEEVVATGLAMKGTVKKGMDKAYQGGHSDGYKQYNG